MVQTLISFGSGQPHLRKAPELISGTDAMSIWQLTLSPEEYILCQPNDALYLWIALEDGKARVMTDKGASITFDITTGPYNSTQPPLNAHIATQLTNIGKDDLKLLVIEDNMPKL